MSCQISCRPLKKTPIQPFLSEIYVYENKLTWSAYTWSYDYANDLLFGKAEGGMSCRVLHKCQAETPSSAVAIIRSLLFADVMGNSGKHAASLAQAFACACTNFQIELIMSIPFLTICK